MALSHICLTYMLLCGEVQRESREEIDICLQVYKYGQYGYDYL
jgi:hypothetical protein